MVQWKFTKFSFLPIIICSYMVCSWSNEHYIAIHIFVAIIWTATTGLYNNLPVRATHQWLYHCNCGDCCYYPTKTHYGNTIICYQSWSWSICSTKGTYVHNFIINYYCVFYLHNLKYVSGLVKKGTCTCNYKYLEVNFEIYVIQFIYNFIISQECTEWLVCIFH